MILNRSSPGKTILSSSLSYKSTTKDRKNKINTTPYNEKTTKNQILPSKGNTIPLLDIATPPTALTSSHPHTNSSPEWIPLNHGILCKYKVQNTITKWRAPGTLQYSPPDHRLSSLTPFNTLSQLIEATQQPPSTPLLKITTV
jgi:hypothetical protein